MVRILTKSDRMPIIWTDAAWADYCAWQREDKRTLKRINLLIKDALRSPFRGIGKPEPLQWQWKGAWSRRIDAENRLIYSVRQDGIVILSVRDHYDSAR